MITGSLLITATDYEVDTMICDFTEAVWAVGVLGITPSLLITLLTTRLTR